MRTRPDGQTDTQTQTCTQTHTQAYAGGPKRAPTELKSTDASVRPHARSRRYKDTGERAGNYRRSVKTHRAFNTWCRQCEPAPVFLSRIEPISRRSPDNGSRRAGKRAVNSNSRWLVQHRGKAVTTQSRTNGFQNIDFSGRNLSVKCGLKNVSFSMKMLQETCTF